MNQLTKGSKFLFSLFNKDGEEGHVALQLAEQLRLRGVQILASGGTRTFLQKHGHQVTDVAEITGLDPVLGHRVVTLAPQLHGGLLAEEEHLEELARLGWPLIVGVCMTFYDTQAAMQKEDATYKSVNEAIDIGGPALVRSANKGGRIAIADGFHMETLTRLLKKGVELNLGHIKMFQAGAAKVVADYCQFESNWRTQQFINSLMEKSQTMSDLMGN